MHSPLFRLRRLLVVLTSLSWLLFGCSLIQSTSPDAGQPRLETTVVTETADASPQSAAATPTSRAPAASTEPAGDTEMAADNSMADNNMSDNAMVGGPMMALPSLDGLNNSDIQRQGIMGDGGPVRELGDGPADQAIAIAAADEEMAWHISHYNWNADAYQENEESTIWTMEFWSEDSAGEYEEWLAWAEVDLADGSVRDAYVPRELTAEEFQEGQMIAEALVLNDIAVQAAVGDISLWEYDTYYDRWDEAFYVSLWYGLDEIYVSVRLDEESRSYYVEQITDANVLEAAEQAELERNQAIELAWEAEGIWDVLQNYDDWTTYVENQGGSQYSVAFVTTDAELFYAIVDIESWTVLEAGSGS